MFEDVIDLIQKKRVAFPSFGSGVSESAIDKAEVRLGIPLPPSYRWWLRSYGGGQIGSDIVYGIDENDIKAPDIVRLHEEDIADSLRQSFEVVFYMGNGESFYFDTRQALESGEYPIYYDEAGQTVTLYANSFDEFLRRRIIEVMGN